MTNNSRPLILAPAGNKDSFLAALAAKADAVYCGMKSFSARMEAKNFSVEELASLTRLAHEKGTEVYVAVNSLMKPGDLETAGKLLDQLNRWVKPDALIIQDLALLQLAEQTGFSGELHLSTLANVSFPLAMKLIRKKFGTRISRVVVPRELNIDEIRQIAQESHQGPDLEVFIHGALCYGVSGRCYWSSYFGGKSGLRGRCVQPCRRLYTQKSPRTKPGKPVSKDLHQGKGERKRFFSCQDLSLDVLVKVLLSVPNIRAWKIEGRKKGPHYVFYTVKAYQLLRDHGDDPQMRKAAVGLLDQALGRTGTHYHFLPQRPWNPVDTDGQTGSGFLMGRVKGGTQKPYFLPRDELLPGDVLRIGYEDDAWHCIQKIRKHVPKKGRMNIKAPSQKRLPEGAPVFLTDRREKALQEMLSQLEAEQHEKHPPPQAVLSNFHVRPPKRHEKRRGTKPSAYGEIHLSRQPRRATSKGQSGLWMSLTDNAQFSIVNFQSVWWWLPPALWPEDEKKWAALIDRILKKGGRRFVLNAPWQMAFFDHHEPGRGDKKTRGPRNKKTDLLLWAGPFCNMANALAIRTMADMGFSGVIVSPELGGEDYVRLPKQSPLPLGIVISGSWPLCVSRVFPENLKPDIPFVSPKGEHAWVRKHGSDVWVYPNWNLNITAKKETLHRAGYRMFVHIVESLPRTVTLKKRPGIWNWDLNLL